MTLTSTITAPATIPGTGAVSIVRVSGPDALGIASRVVTLRRGSISDAAGYTLHYGSIDQLDDVIVSVFRAPHSYTGEDSVEISCHASSYIVSELLRRLCAEGAVMAEPGEFTRRAFVNGKMDLSQAEAVADVIASRSEASHRIAMHQLRGGISSELQVLRSKLLDLTSMMELELDFSEEEVEFADRSALLSLLDSALAHIGRLTESFRLGNAIRTGVPVAIVGATNTGKSTLLNAMLGEERAIVSPVAGTTRDTVEEVFNIGGTQFRLIDTAGIRDTSDEIESQGIDRTWSKLLMADIVVHVMDITASATQLAASSLLILSKLNLATQKYVAVLNKVDRLCPPGLFTGVGAGMTSGLVPGASASLESDFIPGAEPYHDVAAARDKSAGIPGEWGERGEAPKCNFYWNLWVNKTVSEYNNIVNASNYKIDTIIMSAKCSWGVDALQSWLSQSQKARISDSGTAVLVSNERHYNALCAASRALSSARSALLAGISGDLVSQDLREAIGHLGAITGEAITTDEVLGNIFKKFCIGK